MEMSLVGQLCSSPVYCLGEVMTSHAHLMEFKWKEFISVINRHFAPLHSSLVQEGYLFIFIAMVFFYNEMVYFIQVSKTLLKLLCYLNIIVIMMLLL